MEKISSKRLIQKYKLCKMLADVADCAFPSPPSSFSWVRSTARIPLHPSGLVPRSGRDQVVPMAQSSLVPALLFARRRRTFRKPQKDSEAHVRIARPANDIRRLRMTGRFQKCMLYQVTIHHFRVIYHDWSLCDVGVEVIAYHQSSGNGLETNTRVLTFARESKNT